MGKPRRSWIGSGSEVWRRVEEIRSSLLLNRRRIPMPLRRSHSLLPVVTRNPLLQPWTRTAESRTETLLLPSALLRSSLQKPRDSSLLAGVHRRDRLPVQAMPVPTPLPLVPQFRTRKGNLQRLLMSSRPRHTFLPLQRELRKRWLAWFATLLLLLRLANRSTRPCCAYIMVLWTRPPSPLVILRRSLSMSQRCCSVWGSRFSENPSSSIVAFVIKRRRPRCQVLELRIPAALVDCRPSICPVLQHRTG